MSDLILAAVIGLVFGCIGSALTLAFHKRKHNGD